MLVSVKNYTFENSTSGRGKTNEFMRVGLFNGEALFVSFIIATRKNNSRVLTYTFASQPDTDDRVEGDADE
ncbi:hypothetical protein SAMN04489801_4658 [Pseudomonas mandelii]|uniref:BrnT family toxin n=1 Tax=Pseudomonas mandelii TaxID=75612 RepID=A0ABY0VV93_9PSED|nr:hypothetical protein SAMN04489801_4658 [Pseudomonas mandelii]